ncbi:protein RADIALIS-like 3 [Neltuma alba]|uniref:protein RADIALIS-like 3 n=1 Tax=Neltuma alba TaxID=207710 RepID=UPI0010A3337C|nr:protein RADIALIS-like 3 [Prosopis alba]
MEQWNRETHKLFENALLKYPEERPDRWERIADEIPGATKEMVLQRYQELLDDLAAIEEDRVPIPSDADDPDDWKMNEYRGEQGTNEERSNSAEREEWMEKNKFDSEEDEEDKCRGKDKEDN